MANRKNHEYRLKHPQLLVPEDLRHSPGFGAARCHGACFPAGWCCIGACWRWGGCRFHWSAQWRHGQTPRGQTWTHWRIAGERQWHTVWIAVCESDYEQWAGLDLPVEPPLSRWINMLNIWKWYIHCSQNRAPWGINCDDTNSTVQTNLQCLKKKSCEVPVWLSPVFRQMNTQCKCIQSGPEFVSGYLLLSTLLPPSSPLPAREDCILFSLYLFAKAICLQWLGSFFSESLVGGPCPFNYSHSRVPPMLHADGNGIKVMSSC